MRIVAGKYRHRLIDYPQDGGTRPTMDRVREAFMSAIGPSIYNKVVLDLFAGSGALGIESLSRGAKECTFVDNSKEAIRIIKDNIRKINIEETTKVVQANYMDFLIKNQDKKYSLVFLDPPYAKKEIYDEVISFMKEHEMLEEDAIVVKESDHELEQDPYFNEFRHYKYGMVHINIYWR